MFDSVLPRRLISIPVVLLALPFVLLISPLLIIGAVVFDLVTGYWRLPTIRLGIFAVVFLVHDWIVLASVPWLWLAGGFGRRLDQDKHSRLQGWVIESLVNWARRLVNVHIDLGDLSVIPDRKVVVLSRHASMIDAVIPVLAIVRRLNRHVHYVLKQELQWDPIFDFLGNRLNNHLSLIHI